MMHHRSLSWKWSSSRSGHPTNLSSSICDVCCARILKSLFLPSICPLRMDAIMFQQMCQKNTESRLSYSCSIHKLKILCGGDVFEKNSSERESQVLSCGTVLATMYLWFWGSQFFFECAIEKTTLRSEKDSYHQHTYTSCAADSTLYPEEGVHHLTTLTHIQSSITSCCKWKYHLKEKSQQIRTSVSLSKRYTIEDNTRTHPYTVV